MYDLTDKVLKQYGEDLLLEMINPDSKDERVSFDLVIKHDVINKEIYGSVTVDGHTQYYHVEDGNNRGTVFEYLSDDPIEVPRTRTIRVAKIVPEVETPLSLAKAEAMKERLDEMSRKINYDAYVTGSSNYTSEYWENEVRKIKGKIVYEDMVVSV